MRSFKTDEFIDKGRLPGKWRNPFLRSIGLSRYRNSAKDTAQILKVDLDVWLWMHEQEINMKLKEISEKLKKK